MLMYDVTSYTVPLTAVQQLLLELCFATSAMVYVPGGVAFGVFAGVGAGVFPGVTEGAVDGVGATVSEGDTNTEGVTVCSTVMLGADVFTSANAPHPNKRHPATTSTPVARRRRTGDVPAFVPYPSLSTFTDVRYLNDIVVLPVSNRFRDRLIPDLRAALARAHNFNVRDERAVPTLDWI